MLKHIHAKHAVLV